MNANEKRFEEVKLRFPHYGYYQKILQAKGFKLNVCVYFEKIGACIIYSKYSEKIGKSLFVEITFDKKIAVYDGNGFRKEFDEKYLKLSWNKMCGDEEILKKFSEFESL